ncbi:MAG: 3-methyl-2-oxobutanoate dehydrogenase subunit beta [Oscillospiraceae bacterium]|nr:3-methyl-2-oxobutanoate dehydrogenase subunit beta [Oscillospiraceae bacterium]
MAKVLMKGNEAIAEAAIRAGCQAFFGYPITPQSEIPEYFARELPKRGGLFLQAESELAAMNMVMGASASGARVLTSTSGPGYCLKLEALAAMTLTRLPAVIVVVMRSGPAFGTMKAAQEDYRMTGNGGYKVVTFAPWNIQEAAEMTFEAFDIADQYRNPVVIMADGMIGQMMEGMDFDKLPAPRRDLPPKTWALHGSASRGGVPQMLYVGDGLSHYAEKHEQETVLYPQITANETRCETVGVEDAEVVFAAYGSAARMCQYVIEEYAGKVRIGMIRPKTLWPFPYGEFEKIGPKCRAVICPEINIIGQMIDDVRIAVAGRLPVSHVGDTAEDSLTPEGIELELQRVLGRKL